MWAVALLCPAPVVHLRQLGGWICRPHGWVCNPLGWICGHGQQTALVGGGTQLAALARAGVRAGGVGVLAALMCADGGAA